MEELRREMLELRQQLDKERAARMQMEEQVSREEESLRECGFTCFVPNGLCHRGHELAASLSEAAAAGVDTCSRQSIGDKPTSWIYLNSRLTQREANSVCRQIS